MRENYSWYATEIHLIWKENNNKQNERENRSNKRIRRLWSSFSMDSLIFCLRWCKSYIQIVIATIRGKERYDNGLIILRTVIYWIQSIAVFDLQTLHAIHVVLETIHIYLMEGLVCESKEGTCLFFLNLSVKDGTWFLLIASNFSLNEANVRAGLK